jgi:hypothetical protein
MTIHDAKGNFTFPSVVHKKKAQAAGPVREKVYIFKGGQFI